MRPAPSSPRWRAQMARGEESRIRIGIGWGLWDVVNRLRVEFAKQHPDVTFEVRDVYCSDDCQEHLRNSTLDVVFTQAALRRHDR